MKLVALYKHPADSAAFDKAYFETHLPLIKKVPGIQNARITHINRTVVGEGFYLMAEMYFADMDALKNAMRSPEMAAAGENLDSFAKDLYTLMFASEE
jgi:uncharacterized protein (TIGR02118 family)